MDTLWSCFFLNYFMFEMRACMEANATANLIFDLGHSDLDLSLSDLKSLHYMTNHH